MPDDIGLFEALYTQRAIRYFKPDPVPDDMIEKLLEAATKAPSGGNRQGWKFLVIRDQAARDVIADYYERARYEDEIKELLGIPENVETAALRRRDLPIGFPARESRYGPTRRAPVEEVTFREKWGTVW